MLVLKTERDILKTMTAEADPIEAITIVSRK
jgi:hypothetical protein